QASGARAAEAAGGTGVEVGGVDDPDDERPHLLGVPAPEAAPGVTGPDRPEDQRERPGDESDRVDAEAQRLEHARGGQAVHHVAEAAPVLGMLLARSDLLREAALVLCLEQLQR